MEFMPDEVKEQLNEDVIEILSTYTGTKLLTMMEEGRKLELSGKAGFTYQEFIVLTVFSLFKLAMTIPVTGVRDSEFTKH